ncbi:type I polyketide synthase [Polyangium spumosum]|uniref:SDR family NAD(P)-dependent oxidoreductase n=1 Tax=Polyangium spumosum TaxID=889282 RepID=A0A6N7Q273_9BACT|nr:type I polyketide synthase [Polyangium spumosum]MRG97807.1 SDR family NAD(P)-dependent oxidoreductase [Polyangium spumosum]
MSDVIEGAVAIIGMAGRFPGAANLSEFWRNLRGGVSGISHLDEAPAEGIVPAAALLEGFDLFDASFFDITRRDAELMDPQRRFFLECAWEALESAGVDPQVYEGSIGVYAGSSASSYLSTRLDMQGNVYEGFQSLLGNDKDYLPTFLSYKLDLKGPSVAIQTACSTSLVAVHVACGSLLARECDVALAGGVTMRLTRGRGYKYEDGFILSPDGHCRAFDERAQGTIFGNGVGVVVLKRLEDALEDGDPIRAVIRGSAINNDGSLKVGFTAPSVGGQTQVIAEALAVARVDPGTIRYIEAHGTGTPIGDPIEMAALKQAFAGVAERGRIAIGALKSSVGHLESAAGIAGLIKAVLAIENGLIPANVDFEKLNPELGIEHSPFYIRAASHEWRPSAAPRRAGVSSFGIGGTNAHVVLEEAPRSSKKSAPPASCHLLPITAKSEAAVAESARRYVGFLGETAADLGDIAFTASLRRRHHAHRLVVSGASKEELAGALAAFLGGGSPPGLEVGQARAAAPKVVFVFPGQGLIWPGVGQRLADEEPAFRDALAACDAAILREAGFSVIAEMRAEEGRSRLAQIDVAQPVLFAIEVALAALWRSYGVEPDLVLGHSMGEVAAACVAGALSLEDTAKVICRRSALLRKVRGKGAMAMVELSMDDAERAIATRKHLVSVAASNGPRSTVISGEPAAIAELLAELAARSVFCQPVKVDVASHSPQMEPLATELRAALAGLAPGPASVAMQSTVTAERVSGPELSREYWAKNLRNPVLFAPVVERLIDDGATLFVEMSPHPSLLPSVNEALLRAKVEGAAVSSLRFRVAERRSILDSLGRLYVHGYPIDFRRLYPEGGRVVDLPSYPWQRERFWIEGATPARPTSPLDVAPAPLLPGCTYELAWRRIEPSPEPSFPRSASFVLFMDEAGLGRALLERLSSLGARCIRVEASGTYSRVGPHAYTIDASRPDDYRRLFQEAFGTAEHCRGVVHLSGLDAAPLAAAPADALFSGAVRATTSAAYAMQAMVRHGFREPPRLFLVTRGAQAVRPGETVSVAQAPLFGLGATIAVEHPELACARIDLGIVEAEAEVELLCRELASREREDTIALRSEGRYAARVVRTDLEGGAPEVGLAADRTYLITGGLGAMGLAFAAWFVELGARSLALLDTRAASEEARSVIAELEAAGARVIVADVDVARREDLARFFAALDADLPELGGVVHAAAVFDDHTLLGQTEASLRASLAPKALGGLHLHELTADRALDFFLVCASLSSLLGSPARANDAASDALLVALARERVRAGLPSATIHWGPFARAGQANAGAPRSLRGMQALTAAEGLAGLRSLLARPRVEVAIARFDVRSWVEFFPTAAGLPLLSELVAEGARSSARAAAPSFVETLLAHAPAERLALLERYVLEHAGAALRLDPARMGRDAPFQSFGVDSLTSLEIRNRLCTGLGLDLSATLLFTYPRASALASHLLDLLEETARPSRHATSSPERPWLAARVDLTRVRDMTEEEAEAALDAEIEALGGHSA